MRYFCQLCCFCQSYHHLFNEGKLCYNQDNQVTYLEQRRAVKYLKKKKYDAQFSNTLMISTPPIMTVAESSERMTSPSPRLLSAKKVTLTIFWKTV